MRLVFLFAVIGCVVSGCAIGNTHRYDLGDAQLDVQSDKTVAVTTVDARSYVVSGDKTPDFSGFVRSGFGIPYVVTTDSGRPLAEDMTISIVKSLEASDVNAVGVPVPPNTDLDSAREKRLAADADRFLLLLINEWKSDVYANIGLDYNMRMDVLQSDGSVVAEKSISGHDDLGGMFVPADARVGAEKAFRGKLEEMLGDPEVVSALQ